MAYPARMGYAVAWRWRWALLRVLVPVLVPTSLILLALRLLAAPEDVAIINGKLAASVPEGFLGFVYALIGGAAWLLGMAAGVIVIGLSSPGTREALKRAWKALPLLVIWGVVGAAATFLAFLIAGGLGLFGIIAFLFLAVLLARLSLVLPSTVLDDGPWWEMARGNTLRVVLRIGIGVVGVPLLLSWCVTRVGEPLLEWFPSVVTGAVVHLLEMLLLFAVIAGQAGTLVAVYRDLQAEHKPEPSAESSAESSAVPSAVPSAESSAESSAEPSAEPEHAGGSEDRSEVHPEPTLEPKPEAEAGVGRPGRWVAVAAVAALALPTFTAAALAPAYGPHISLQRNAFDGQATEIVWNPGQMPVVFSSVGAYTCDDSACLRGEDHVGPFHDLDGFTAVGVASDGARLSARLSRNPDDFLNLERCTKQCEDFGRLDLPKRIETFAIPQFGIAGGPDGSVWVAVAQQRTKASKLELSLIRCGQKRCDDNPKWVKAGSIEGVLSDEAVTGTVHMRFALDGRAMAEFDQGYGTVHIAGCDTAECASASISQRPDARLTAQPFGARWERVIVSQHGYLWVETESAADDTLLRLTIGGQAPRFQRVVLWHCTDSTCQRSRRIPLHITQAPNATSQGPPIRIAVGPDGTILIAEGANIVSLRL